ncbi:MAG: hypothetical protein AAFV29_03320, partial [Myxococcota bacterium]
QALAQALRLEPTLAEEPVLRSMIRDLVGTSSNELASLLKELGEAPDRAWLPLLTELAQTARRFSERRQAWEVLETLGEFGTLEPFAYLSDQLERNLSKKCSIRAWYVRRLIALQDRRVMAIAAEEQTRPRRQRACMDEDLAAVLAQNTPPEE